MKVAQKLHQHVARFPGRRVLVLGDVMLDEYVWGTVARISPEAPVPVVAVQAESLKLGGAGNVAANLAALDGTAELVGVVGTDAAAERLTQELTRAGVKADGLVPDGSRPTTIKSRVVAGSQHVVRFDRESDAPLPPAVRRAVLQQVQARLPQADVLLISDYAKGVIGAPLVRAVLALAARWKTPVAVDPKVNHFATYREVTVLTPNLLEASAGAGIIIDSIDALLEAGRRIVEKLSCDHLIITRGEQGMTLFSRDGSHRHIPAVSREVFDVTGAGDTVVAALALGLAAGLPMFESAWLSNVAAGVVVGEIGTVAITAAQMRERFSELRARER